MVVFLGFVIKWPVSGIIGKTAEQRPFGYLGPTLLQDKTSEVVYKVHSK